VKEFKSVKQRVWVWLTRLSISIHAGMLVLVGQFAIVIKSFQHLSELTIENKENRKPGRRRWVASSVPTQINIHTMRQKNLYHEPR